MNARSNGLEPLLLFGAALLIFCTVRWWILHGLRKAASGADSFPQIAHEYLHTPSLLWAMAAALQIGLDAAALSPHAEHLARNAIAAFVIFSVAMMLNAMLQRGITRLPFAMAGLSRTLTRMLVFGIGLMIMLHVWGISITPVLTALGVGGLAVALALQDTLSNLFAGVHLLVEAPLAVGDFVRTGADEEGTVVDIGWRTTRILTTANSMIIVPNKTLTSGTLINLTMPNPRVGVGIPVLVGQLADLRLVERLALEAARATPGVLADPPPVLIADPGMTPTHLQFRLAFSVEKYLGSALVRTEVTQRMLAAFREQQIPPPEVFTRP